MGSYGFQRTIRLTAEEEASENRNEIYYQRLAATEGVHDLPKKVRNIAFKSGTFKTWPMFVKFGDIDDPKTVREVSASELGVQNITIEIVDEDVTVGITEKLSWLNNQAGSLVKTRPGQSMFDKTKAQRVTGSGFWTGENR